MKIIDLLNKIANKENVPDKIRYRNCIFEKTEGQGISPDYVNNENTFFLEYVSNEADSLNEIVELIEDEEIDIQEVASIKCNFDKENYAVKDINEAFKTFAKLLGMQSDKINELVRAVKKLEKRTRKEKE